MFRKIFVPLDGSRFAENALPFAVSLATRFDAELMLAQVVEPRYTEMFATVSALDRLAARDAGMYLANIQRWLADQGVRSRYKVICDQPVAAQLLAYAKRWSAEAIVLSTHGRSGLSRWMLGSIAEQIVRGATAPVLLVGDVASDEEIPVSPEAEVEALAS